MCLVYPEQQFPRLWQHTQIMGGHYQLRGTVVENQRPFPQVQSDESFTNAISMVELQLPNLWLLNTVLVGEKDGVMITKPGYLMTGNTLYGQVIRPLHCFQRQSGFMFGHHARKPIILNSWFQLWNMEADLWWFGQKYLVFCWSSTLNGRITASDHVDILGSQVHQMVQVLFCNNDAIFQDNNTLIDTARSVQSWFEEHEDALQHLLWLAQLPNLNIIESLWSVLESRVRSRFPPSSLKQLEEEYKMC